MHEYAASSRLQITGDMGAHKFLMRARTEAIRETNHTDDSHHSKKKLLGAIDGFSSHRRNVEYPSVARSRLRGHVILQTKATGKINSLNILCEYSPVH